MPRTIGSVEGEAEVEHDVEDETKNDLVVRPAQRPGHRRLIAIGEEGEDKGAMAMATVEVLATFRRRRCT